MKEKVTRWSLDRLHFLLGHIEGFIESDVAEQKNILSRAQNFSPLGGLENIESFLECPAEDARLPIRVLEKLASFYEAGLLLQRGPAPGSNNANWWITNLFWRGSVFDLALADQVQANHLLKEMTPLQVHKSPAPKLLQSVGLEDLLTAPDADAFLIKPTTTVAYVLLSQMPKPWAADHVHHTHRLVNKCFAL